MDGMAHTFRYLGVSTRGREPSLSLIVSPIIERLKRHNASFFSLDLQAEIFERQSNQIRGLQFQV